MNKGLLMVISAPSGAGKSTLCRALAERRPEVRVCISCTTRAPRGGEVNGRDYHFLTPADFEKRLAAGEFIESARVHDHMYGTLRGPVAEALESGRDALLNIDTQGARSVKAHFPDCVRVFICPPSWAVLEDRLKKRAQDDPAVIAKRLANARGEIEHLPEFDYVVVNDKLEEATEDLLAILRAEKRRPSRIAGDLRKLDLMR
jgi:guanylate kinase